MPPVTTRRGYRPRRLHQLAAGERLLHRAQGDAVAEFLRFAMDLTPVASSAARKCQDRGTRAGGQAPLTNQGKPPRRMVAEATGSRRRVGGLVGMGIP